MKKLTEKQVAVLDAASKLAAQGKPITAGNLTFLVYPEACNEHWTPASIRVQSVVRGLSKRGLWPH